HLVALTHTGFRLYAPAGGRYLVKVHYTPYWQVTAGHGTVGQGADGFTEVNVGRAGIVTVTTHLSLSGVVQAIGMAFEAL
ncbi:MAG: hypothetical protein ACYDA6_11415, partial [Solirubrobacteraceae bacterium]